MTNLIETTQSKKPKLENEKETVDKNGILNDFEFVRILSEDSSAKVIRILAHKIRRDTDQAASKQENDNEQEQSQERAVVIFEKPHFSLDELRALLETDSVKIHLQNDVYNKLSVFASVPYNSMLFSFYFRKILKEIFLILNKSI